MKTVIVLADTHHRTENLERLLPVINETQLCLHLGDYIPDIQRFRAQIVPPVTVVKGNCDFSGGNDYEIVDFEGHKLLLTHGHRYGVKHSLDRLYAFAVECGCEYAFYGHTHIANAVRNGSVTLLNPGSLSRPRQGRPSYALLSLDGDILSHEIICL